MTQSKPSTVAHTPAGFVPCLQCAPAESSPDGAAQCKPDVCPKYHTFVAKRPSPKRQPGAKHIRPPFTHSRPAGRNPRWTWRSWTTPTSTQSPNSYDSSRKSWQTAECSRSVTAPAGS